MNISAHTAYMHILCTRCKATLHVASDPPPTFNRRERIRAIDGALSSTEANEIRQSLELYENDLLQYDEEIAHTRALLTELKEKRSVLQEHIQEHRGLLAAIRKLPMEVLTEVLAAYCGDYCLEISDSLQGRAAAYVDAFTYARLGRMSLCLPHPCGLGQALHAALARRAFTLAPCHIQLM
ncbi:hypothetical protein D9758_012065 [Tetrapyrgos nigripes]|uniref:Uncharacterized protein n=1 Tax=Tetrapyrgos nigripes TaxID=182062 RepID=A0A8H5CCZ2_9AGAR|nr:hypothetical protein D9758_012065 [Tetrapyrgos nigripes]